MLDGNKEGKVELPTECVSMLVSREVLSIGGDMVTLLFNSGMMISFPCKLKVLFLQLRCVITCRMMPVSPFEHVEHAQGVILPYLVDTR